MIRINDLAICLKEGKSEKTIVDNISFDIPAGKSIGIVGESGSGKTITALSILQLLPPGMNIRSGQILLGTDPERDLTTLPEREIRMIRGNTISMIFQEPMTSLNPSMRCGEQIAESVRIHRRTRENNVESIVSSLLDEVRLPSESQFTRKYPHQLSGGQRQRIMIAMALAGNPEILIADEPTTALDVTVQMKILDLLRKIQEQRQMSMLFISHDLGVIRKVCDRALVMYRGKIVDRGEVEYLFAGSKHPYTRGLVACRPGRDNIPIRLPVLEDFTVKSAETVVRPIRKPVPQTGLDRPALLRVDQLSVEYTLQKNFLGKSTSKLTVVDNISFHIHEGETLGLIGESGCGKSTLGLSLIRLIGSREGNILYRGKEVSSLQGNALKQFRQKVQFIFQDPYSSLNPRITAGNSIMEVMRVHRVHDSKRERKETAIGLLEKVGLDTGHFYRYPHEFSGGQRQRIGIARALACEPEFIICDESVSSLDVSVQAMVLNLLNDLKDTYNLTYLFISHDLSVVNYMSDRVMVMKEGKLLEQGNADEVFNKPVSDYTRELINSIPE